MDHIANSLDSVRSTASSPTSSEPVSSTSSTAATRGETSATPPRAKPSPSLADFVWAHMAGLFGHTWTSAYGNNPRSIAGAEWATTLAGLSRAQVEAGIDACRAEGGEFPPSAPRFRGMCLGIPSFAAVQFEITSTEAERSPFTRCAWQFIDAHAYRSANTRDATRMLRDAYDLARDLIMRGQPLPAPAAPIPHQPKPVVLATPEQRQSHLAEIASMLGMSPAEAEAMGADGLRKAAGEMP